LAKNLKLKVKNAQLAQALSKLKKPGKEPQEKKAPKKTAAKKVAPKDADKDNAPKKMEAQIIRKASDIRAEEERKKQEALEAKKAPVKEPKAEVVETPAPEKAPEKAAPKVVKQEKSEKAAEPKTEKSVKATPAKEGESADKKSKPLGPVKDKKDVKPAKKQQSFRPFDSRDRLGLRSDDDAQQWRRRRPYKQRRSHDSRAEPVRPNEIKVRIPITVKDLAHEMKLKAGQLIQKLFLEGMVITVNDYIDDPTVLEILGAEFKVRIEIDTSEEERLAITGHSIKEELAATSEEELKHRAPVVTFMGHVDHGKTSLVDFIRKSNIAGGEAGAITQHIGAFKVNTSHGDLAILDTPGHEAFTLMRERGAAVTDIVILVVAGDEGIKPQTDEAIKLALDANIPLVIAINKADKEGFNTDNVYRQLADRNLLPEAWGGEVLTVNCSAKSGDGIAQLLEMTALQAEMQEPRANPHSRARGTVIESELHKGLGCVATVLVQNGTLKMGDALVLEQIWGRVKTMHDDHGRKIESAGPSTPVKITGLSGLPEAGCEFVVVDSEREARKLCEGRRSGEQRAALKARGTDFEALLARESEMMQKKVVPVIIRADVQGSVEALKNSLEKIKSEKIELNIVSAEVGEVSESDVELAAASNAVIIAFHTLVESHAEDIIKREKVNIRSHDIIYHVVDDVKDIMRSRLDKVREETYAGMAEVRQVFKSSHLGNIAGCIVSDGTITRDSYAKLYRNDKLVWEGNIASLKRVKEDVKEVNKGLECGILLDGFKTYEEGDQIKTYKITYVSQDL